jgi:hypothetical protein
MHCPPFVFELREYSGKESGVFKEIRIEGGRAQGRVVLEGCGDVEEPAKRGINKQYTRMARKMPMNLMAVSAGMNLMGGIG